MKKHSSKYVPLFIIVILIFFAFFAILFNDISASSIRSYDILGLNNIRHNTSDTSDNKHEMSETKALDQLYSPIVSEQNNPINVDSSKKNNNNSVDSAEKVTKSEDAYYLADNSEASDNPSEKTVTESIVETNMETKVEPETKFEIESKIENSKETATSDEAKQQINELVVDNSQKKTNDVIELDKTYTRTIVEHYDKVDFYTTDADCDYRVLIKTNINDSPVYGAITFTMYDERGITVSKSNPVFPTYGNTTDYCDEFCCDFNIQKSQKHTLKITNSNSDSGGDYQISIITLERDAGTSKENAKKIHVGEEVTAVLNSSISDWFVCNISEVGTYKFILHNIDTGCNINVEASYQNASLFTKYYIENETSFSNYFNINRAGDVFINIIPGSNTPQGNYIMSVIKD